MVIDDEPLSEKGNDNAAKILKTILTGNEYHQNCDSILECERLKQKEESIWEFPSLKEKILSRFESKDKFFSLEFFPPRTKGGAVNLLARFDRMREGGPLFCDITWHPAGNPDSEAETSSMGIAGAALNYSGLETMLHMTCSYLGKEKLRSHLQNAKQIGLRNILALRGDMTNDSTNYHILSDRLPYAADFVRFIRKEFGDYFVIGVAAYPLGHPESPSYEQDLIYLKEKVDAGADFIITQLFFKAATFVRFYNDCRAVGINVPIIPGLMPIQSYESLRHIAKLSKLDVPEDIMRAVAPLKDNDEAIRCFGIDHCVQLIKDLFDADVAHGVHFYTLNREVATTSVLKQVGLWAPSIKRPFPWRLAVNHKRCKEDVRPIFWSSRPKAYVYRTRHWDEFPNGRWGSSESPAFGDLKDYYLFYLKSNSSKTDLLNMWGQELNCEQDVWKIFYYYLTGEKNLSGHKVTKTPWNDDELSPETSLLTEKLAYYNLQGVLTINSQPNVNGENSDNEVVGWGMPGGYVYQKAYLEFFISEQNVIALRSILHKFSKVNYNIINKTGSQNFTNCHKHRSLAVTWGVFPGTEIIQPTIVDSQSFKVWKDEAFALWTQQWANLYDEGSRSRSVLEHITNNYYLVTLVDNDYPKDTCLWDVLDLMLAFQKDV